MGCARYVGRVGALALALGVGSAIAWPTAVAWAEPTVGSPSSAHASASTGRHTTETERAPAASPSDSADTSTKSIAGGEDSKDMPSADGSEPAAATKETSDSEIDGGADQSDALDEKGSGSVEVVDSADDDKSATPTARSKRSGPRIVTTHRNPITHLSPADEGAGVPTSVITATSGDEAAPVVRTLAVPRSAVAIDSTVDVGSPASEESSPVLGSGAMMTTVVSSPLIPSSPAAPLAPVESPLLWGLLAFARRQPDQQTGGLLAAAAAVNSAPTVRSTAGVPNSTTGVVTGRIIGRDKDRDPLNYSVDAISAKGGTVSVDNVGKFTYIPTAAARHAAATSGATDADKTDTFTATVDDGQGHVVPVTVTVRLRPVNAKPTDAAVTGLSTDLTSGDVTGTVVASDADNDDLTITGPASTRKGTLAIGSNGAFTYTPTAAARAAASAPRAGAAAKTDTFTVTVDDGHGGRQTLRVQVDIAPLVQVNQAPTITSIAVGQPDSSTGRVTGIISATDPDGDPVTFGNPAGPSTTWTTASGATVTINPSSGAFSYTPEPIDRLNAYTHPDQRNDSFDVTFSDGHNPAQLVSVPVTIDPTRAAVIRTVKFPGIYSNLVVGADGTIATTNLYSVGESTVIDLAVAHPDGTTTTRTITANPVETPIVGADGTVVIKSYDSNPQIVTVTVVHPDGAVTTTEPITRDANGDLRVAIGSHGTVALSNIRGSGSSSDPNNTITITVILDGLAGAGELLALRCVARRLQREHEAIRRLRAPRGIACRFLRAVVRAVDLDRGHVAACVFELSPLHEACRIEVASPRRIGPSAGAGANARWGARGCVERHPESASALIRGAHAGILPHAADGDSRRDAIGDDGLGQETNHDG